MKKYIINGKKKLKGEIILSGSKNVVLKTLVAACLTLDEVEISNVPLISDFYTMVELIKTIGGTVKISGHRIKVRLHEIKSDRIPLEIGAKTRASSMFLSPLLARKKRAIIPNPGGCRIGARPIDRHIAGLKRMGVKVNYNSNDGYFYFSCNQLTGTNYTFEKNTHTGTETLILAGVLAKGRTVLDNCALEPEVDDLISMLNSMGARVKRYENKRIVIEGVQRLHGTSFKVMSDRNELVTFALLSALSSGQIWIKSVDLTKINTFLEAFQKSGGKWICENSAVRFFLDNDKINPVDIVTKPYPGFMTDWQGPWAIFMTQATGKSEIHETIYEDRFSYINELLKMGADIEFFNPKVNNPEKYYNFNYAYADRMLEHAVKIKGPTSLHNAVLNIQDLRAGATLVIAALIAKGESVVFGVEHIERGYEDLDKRLRSLGADIKLVE